MLCPCLGKKPSWEREQSFQQSICHQLGIVYITSSPALYAQGYSLKASFLLEFGPRRQPLPALSSCSRITSSRFPYTWLWDLVYHFCPLVPVAVWILLKYGPQGFMCWNHPCCDVGGGWEFNLPVEFRRVWMLIRSIVISVCYPQWTKERRSLESFIQGSAIRHVLSRAICFCQVKGRHLKLLDIGSAEP